MDQQLGLSVREALGILTLILSLVGNAFQFYRQKLYARTIYNGLVATFNNIGWVLARCMQKTKEVSDRERDMGRGAPERAIFREFLDYSLDTEFKLRGLHEHRVGVAKTLRSKDQRWQAGEFGYTRDELERFRASLTASPS